MTDNPPIRIFINKIENRITFKVETGYYKECLTLKTMKLLGSTKNEITKNENGDNVLHSEITEILLVHVLLVHCNRANNDYEHDSWVLYILFPNKSFNKWKIQEETKTLNTIKWIFIVLNV